jgi:hypothetical protein
MVIERVLTQSHLINSQVEVLTRSSLTSDPPPLNASAHVDPQVGDTIEVFEPKQ